MGKARVMVDGVTVTGLVSGKFLVTPGSPRLKLKIKDCFFLLLLSLLKNKKKTNRNVSWKKVKRFVQRRKV